ncbi:hypothetical protein EHQ94_10850 [Leptospira meyeri]|uniref:hypothetical protein n=1 Tax=Leptospira meyeri TaxID=29508 RepID=UPI00108263F1|nr:hypothetical protein [Leptospira meyeri]TGM58954.1 hypothetical protein EHQ93_19670 [Leptospira meyeri]TGM66502.1 hypothetical protein EHQ94_10850 [Leptospira meyeri]
MINYQFDYIKIIFHSAGPILTVLLIIELDIIGNWKKLKEFFFFIIFLNIAEELILILINIGLFWPYAWLFEESFAHSIATLLFTWDGFHLQGKIGLWPLIFKLNKGIFFSDFIAFIIMFKIYPFKFYSKHKDTLNHITVPYYIYLFIIYLAISLSNNFQNAYTTGIDFFPFTKTIDTENPVTQIWNVPFLKLTAILLFLGFYGIPILRQKISQNIFYISFAYYCFIEFIAEFLTISASYISIFSNKITVDYNIQLQDNWDGLTGIQILSVVIFTIIIIKLILKKNVA